MKTTSDSLEQHEILKAAAKATASLRPCVAKRSATLSEPPIYFAKRLLLVVQGENAGSTKNRLA